jgi:hypothetical protein
MSYSAEISRDNPTAILFPIDQSRSMDEKIVGGKSKAEFVAHQIASLPNERRLTVSLA